MEEAVVKRVMPHSNEAEQAVIGSMLMDADAITTAMEKISEDDFYNKQYGSLFKAMIELYNEGKTCDLVTVKSKLEETGVPSEVVSLDFIRNIWKWFLHQLTLSSMQKLFTKNQFLEI